MLISFYVFPSALTDEEVRIKITAMKTGVTDIKCVKSRYIVTSGQDLSIWFSCGSISDVRVASIDCPVFLGRYVLLPERIISSTHPLAFYDVIDKTIRTLDEIDYDDCFIPFVLRGLSTIFADCRVQVENLGNYRRVTRYKIGYEVIQLERAMFATPKVNVIEVNFFLKNRSIKDSTNTIFINGFRRLTWKN